MANDHTVLQRNTNFIKEYILWKLYLSFPLPFLYESQQILLFKLR